MKRKKQTAVQLALIAAFSVCIILLGDFYFSPAQVFEQYRKGLGYAPVEEIRMERKMPDGSVFIVGRSGDTLVTVEAKQRMGIFWKYESGVSGQIVTEEEKFDGSLAMNGMYVGLCKDPDITEIYLLGGDSEKWQFQEYTCPVEEDGFFWCETDLDPYKGDYEIYAEARNEKGGVIEKKGSERIAKKVWAGEEKKDEPVLTKPFITAP